MTAMLKLLLADRFRLQLRLETQISRVYDLVVDKGGSKLKALADGGKPRCTRDTVPCGITDPAGLAHSLKYIVGRPVMDRTGINGRYEILLDFDTFAYRGGTPPAGYNKPSLEKVPEDWDFDW